jgi:formyltetrahydrofolate-dependent phosphoribosylglycinamide formyltransferase
MHNIVVLISGGGSNMAAIVRAAQQGRWADTLNARVAAVISNQGDAKGLRLAAQAGVPTAVLDHKTFASREAFDAALMALVDDYQPTLVVLAGFMRILTPAFVSHYAGRLLNIHPSLLPAFPGLHTHQRAIEAGCKVAGATVHQVTAELDHGPILAQAVVPVLPDDSADSLAARVLSQEHVIYPQAICQWLDAQARQRAAAFDIKNLPADFFANPYPYYDALIKHAPVKKMPDGSVFVTRFADLDFIYKNPAIFSSDKRREFKPKYGDSPLYEHHTTSLVFNDPPAHTRVRRLISGALTPRAIALMEPGLRHLVDGLLDTLAHKAAQGQPLDLIADFASAIPVEVIGNLLAVPLAKRAHLRDWSLAILGALEPVVSPEAFARGNQAVTEFSAFLTELIEKRRAQPGDAEFDVLTRLINGEKDAKAEALNTAELIHNCIFLLNAGHETTTNLIGNGLVLLLQNPATRHQLQAHPDLIKSTVEEILRFESSNQLGNRITTQAVTLGGVDLPAGTPVTLCMGAANRDPAQFAHPHTLDITRQPNHHIAFAGGIHKCAGMALARLEGTVAIAGFMARFPQAQLLGTPARNARARFRGFGQVAFALS